MRIISHSFLVHVSSIATRTGGRLGILFPDWLEIPQEGAVVRHVPPPLLEEKDGPVRPHRGLRHLPTGGGISESCLTPLSNIAKYVLYS